MYGQPPPATVIIQPGQPMMAAPMYAAPAPVYAAPAPMYAAPPQMYAAPQPMVV